MVTSMTDAQELDGKLSFARWLFAQAKGDQGKMMPYAAIYRWGRTISEFLGTDGPLDAESLSVELASQGASADDLAALVSAEASWRVDTLIDRAEEAGVPLPDQPTEVDTVAVSEALAVNDAKVLCGYRNHRGEGCTEEAIPGAGRCGRHGGSITDPEVRRSFMLVAFAKVIGGAQDAVEALLDVAINGRSEMARVQAAKEILDRAGVQQDQHVHIHAPGEDASEDDIIEELQRRLGVATDRLRIHALPVSSEDTTTEQLALSTVTQEFIDAATFTPSYSDDDIVDAVVVE